jgi:hypothetical protein
MKAHPKKDRRKIFYFRERLRYPFIKDESTEFYGNAKKIYFFAVSGMTVRYGNLPRQKTADRRTHRNKLTGEGT